MKEYVFAIGDVHGDYDLLQAVLTDYDRQLHQLVFMGDLGDRGPQSKACFMRAKQLVEEDGAIYLKGNHEDLLLHMLAEPAIYFDHYVQNGGGETLESLLHPGALAEYSATEIQMKLRYYYPDLWPFLSELPLYYEWNKYLFVHAGVDLSKHHWQDTSPHDFMWIRSPFHAGKNTTGKTIVFGHTITPALHGDNETTDLWLSDDKVGIDGGAIYGGSLHGVIFSKTGIIQDIEYQKLTPPWQPIAFE